MVIVSTVLSHYPTWPKLLHQVLGPYFHRNPEMRKNNNDMKIIGIYKSFKIFKQNNILPLDHRTFFPALSRKR